TTRLIGSALGLDDRAEELIAEVEAKHSRIQDDHPNFVGATAVVAADRGDGTVGIYAPHDLRTRVLPSLGFEVPSEIAELFGDEFNSDLSAERLDLRDSADLIVWRNERAEVAAHPIYWTLGVAE